MNEQVAEMNKPGMVKAIAIMNLVNGILNILTGLSWLAMFIFIVTIPIGVYSLIVGILELINSSRLLPDPIKLDRPPKNIAVMEIINIISGNIVSLIVGILSLVFYQDDNVKSYFDRQKGTT